MIRTRPSCEPHKVRVPAAETEPKWRSALVLRKVSDFDVDAFKGRQGLPGSDAAPILAEDVDRGVIRNSEATEDSRRLVHIGGVAAVMSPSAEAVCHPAPSSRLSSVPTWDAVCACATSRGDRDRETINRVGETASANGVFNRGLL